VNEVENLHETFEGVNPANNMTLKISDMGIANRQQANRMRRETFNSDTSSTREDSNINTSHFLPF